MDPHGKPKSRHYRQFNEWVHLIDKSIISKFQIEILQIKHLFEKLSNFLRKSKSLANLKSECDS
jgi:hypothetical protein